MFFAFQRRAGFLTHLGTLSPSSTLSSTEGGFSDPPLNLIVQEIVFLMEKWHRHLACDCFSAQLIVLLVSLFSVELLVKVFSIVIIFLQIGKNTSFRHILCYSTLEYIFASFAQVFRSNFPKDKRMKKFFNMIEITLALAIIGIGVTGIMVLFPVGLKSSQDAIADNYASNSAETIMNYFRRAADQNWTVIQNLLTEIPDYNGSNDNTSIDVPSATWTTLIPQRLFQHNTINGLYRIYQGTQGAAYYDFTAAVRIWKTPLLGSVYYDDGAGPTGWRKYDYNTDNCVNSRKILS